MSERVSQAKAGLRMVNGVTTETGKILHQCHEADDGFKHLLAHVAPNAYASQQEGDAPKCHPNTRNAVLHDIMDWIVLTVMRVQWVMWVYGAAGAGKSSIARTIVDICLGQNIPIARFFLYRTDSMRNTLDPLVATLVYQIIQLLPELESIIIPKIEANPLIFKESFETQISALIVNPIQELHYRCPLIQPLLILIDGVDECIVKSAHSILIRTLCSLFSGEEKVPIIVLLTSRAEAQIQAEFRAKGVAQITRRLALDDTYLPDRDIRLFLDDKFAEIKETHISGSSLPPMWPDPLHVEEIVQKSSGQFIFASVAINFIFDPRRYPETQLKIIRGLQPPGNMTPFAQLDALYCYVFSQVNDLELVLLLLAYFIFSGFGDISTCCDFFQLPKGELILALVDLASVVDIGDDDFRFLHASLPDFLCDQTRSKRFYIGRALWSERLALMWLSRKTTPSGFIITDFLLHAECTPKLQESIRNFKPTWAMRFTVYSWSMYLTSVSKMDFGDGGETYRQQLLYWTTYIRTHRPDELHPLYEKHDVVSLLAQLETRGSPNAIQKRSLAARLGSKFPTLFKKS